jgi:hypothetical protein
VPHARSVVANFFHDCEIEWLAARLSWHENAMSETLNRAEALASAFFCFSVSFSS